MIIVKLVGGLGNQMAQYAMGRILSTRNKMELKLDLRTLRIPGKNIPRSYELKIFNIKEKFASPEEVASFSTKREPLIIEKSKYFIRRIITASANGLQLISPYLFNVFDKKMLLFFSQMPIIGKHYLFPVSLLKIPPQIMSYHQRYVYERQTNFDPEIFKIKWPVYLDGYWGTWKYFQDIEEIIRKDFTFKNPLEGKNQEISRDISIVNSVSLHIRRGDYVTLPSAIKMHGNICGLQYYHKAVKIIASRIKDPHFFIFSDDINWARENLKIEYPITYIDFNTGEKSYIDMQLMSLCKHNIIANSSFSWWGAWLNRNKDKIVIAPNKWLNDPTLNTCDVIPKNWTTIESK